MRLVLFILAIFLTFQSCFALDNSTNNKENLQYAIIISYFAYYPLMLFACTSAAIARTKAMQPVRNSQEESPQSEKNPAGEVSGSPEKAFDDEKR